MSAFSLSVCQGIVFFVFLLAVIVGAGLLRLYLIWRFNRRAFWKLRF